MKSGQASVSYNTSYAYYNEQVYSLFDGIAKYAVSFKDSLEKSDKEVFNGDIGTICSIDLEESQLQIEFGGRKIEYESHELDEVSLAYAASIHKSQGSEYPAVVIPLATQHYMMLERNLVSLPWSSV